MLTRLLSVSVLLASTLALASPVALAAEGSTAHQGRGTEAGARALVVFVGTARESGDLEDVLTELLERQGVTPEFERRDRFRASAFLAEGTDDDRVWVFVTVGAPRRAKLYFRGPQGKRFLLRQLTLKNGLDELGRELIAQVVETSTTALLRSDAGISREEAKAGLVDANEPLDPPEPAKEGRAPSPPASSKEQGGHLRYELSLRGVARWAGPEIGLDHAVGLETGLTFVRAPGLFLRGRLAFEQGLGQSIDTSALHVRITTTALRAGADVGTSAGESRFVAGASAGVDVAQISPETTRDASLELAEGSTGVGPMIRVEARYELTLGAFQVTGGLFGDVSLLDTHYDVADSGGRRRIAEPWTVRPAVALTMGWVLR